MNNKRVLYFDILNVISCFCVVCLHSNGYVHSFEKDNWWWLRVFVEVVCYFAVPVFFMLSGATLMRYRERYTTKDFVRKRFLKVLFPYVFWGILFSFLYVYFSGFTNVSIKEILFSFITGKIHYTNYWFFIPLFLLYIYIPFLSVMVVRLGYKQLFSLILILLFFQSLLPTIYAFFGLKYAFSLPISGYFIYALLGYFLATYNVEKHVKLCGVIYALALLSLIVRYILIYYSDSKESILFTYFGLYAIFPSIAVFLLCKTIHTTNNRVSNVFSLLAKRSYGIFLIHTFLICLLSNVLSKKSPLFILSAVLVYIVSLIIVMVLQKTKLTRHIVP